MLQLDVKIAGDAKVMEKLKALGEDFLEFDEAMHEIGEELISYYGGQAYKSQGGVYGTPWAQLAPSTQAYKIKHYPQYAAVPLMRTGAMAKSFGYVASAKEVEILNVADYFVYHQSSEPRHKLPRRPMLGVNDDVKKVIKKVIEEDLRGKLRSL